MDGGTEADVKRELCRYLNGLYIYMTHTPREIRAIKRYINSVNWISEDPAPAWWDDEAQNNKLLENVLEF